MWYFSVKMEHVSFYHIKIQETTGTISTTLNIIQNWVLRVEYHHKICDLHFDNKHLHYNFICNKTLSMLSSSKNILLCSHFVYCIVTFSQLLLCFTLTVMRKKENAQQLLLFTSSCQLSAMLETFPKNTRKSYFKEKYLMVQKNTQSQTNAYFWLKLM